MDFRLGAIFRLVVSVFLLAFGVGLVTGANLPDRLVREVPRPVPGFWEWLDQTLPRRPPTFADLYPPPSNATAQIAAVDFLATYKRAGMSGVMVEVQNCYSGWNAYGRRTREALMRCALLDRIAVRVDRGFRQTYRLPDGSVLPPLSPELAPERVLAREKATAKVLFGGGLREQNIAFGIALMPVMREFASPEVSRAKIASKDRKTV